MTIEQDNIKEIRTSICQVCFKTKTLQICYNITNLYYEGTYVCHDNILFLSTSPITIENMKYMTINDGIKLHSQ